MFALIVSDFNYQYFFREHQLLLLDQAHCLLPVLFLCLRGSFTCACCLLTLTHGSMCHILHTSHSPLLSDTILASHVMTKFLVCPALGIEPRFIQWLSSMAHSLHLQMATSGLAVQVVARHSVSKPWRRQKRYPLLFLGEAFFHPQYSPSFVPTSLMLPRHLLLAVHETG